MSELTNKSGNGGALRSMLLVTACGAALLITLYASQPVMASDGDAHRPIVWIELGGQFAQLENGQQGYLPPFVLGTSRPPFITGLPIGTEKNAPTSWDGKAKISFELPETDWAFSASIVYGRNTKNKSLNQRTAQRNPTNPYHVEYSAYQNLTAKNDESHMVLDFSAGKDVGLGGFEYGGSSIFSVGLRYAQFDSRSSVGIQYQPTNVDSYYHPVHRFYGSFAAARKFVGIGPSLSWNASAGLIDDPLAGGISVDWGINGAVLFGRQHTAIHHQTSNFTLVYPNRQPDYQHSVSVNRSKGVIAPNLGGFAGVSWHYADAKISFGYRADMFFGALDGGIAAQKSYNREFYGPFATVSVGIGG